MDVDLTGRDPTVNPGGARSVSQTTTDNPSEDASIGELVSATTRDLSQLFQAEVQLAKVELREEAKKAGQAGAMFGAAALLGYLALTLLCFAAAWGLSEIVPEGVAFLIVAIIVGIVAAVLGLQGKKRMADVDGPKQTIETLQEDVQWAKQQKS